MALTGTRPCVEVALPPELKAGIESQAAAAYPEECCGLLVGALTDDFAEPGARLTVAGLRPLRNAWESAARTHRYTADPLEFARAEREAAQAGAAILGIYHSHPDVPAWPSPFDLLRAWPNYAYAILSVRAGQAAELRVWRLSGDGASFLEGVIH